MTYVGSSRSDKGIRDDLSQFLELVVKTYLGHLPPRSNKELVKYPPRDWLPRSYRPESLNPVSSYTLDLSFRFPYIH